MTKFDAYSQREFYVGKPSKPIKCGLKTTAQMSEVQIWVWLSGVTPPENVFQLSRNRKNRL